jgi:hypothetical protein
MIARRSPQHHFNDDSTRGDGPSAPVKPENKINNIKLWANRHGVLSGEILELMLAKPHRILENTKKPA